MRRQIITIIATGVAAIALTATPALAADKPVPSGYDPPTTYVAPSVDTPSQSRPPPCGYDYICGPIIPGQDAQGVTPPGFVYSGADRPEGACAPMTGRLNKFKEGATGCFEF